MIGRTRLAVLLVAAIALALGGSADAQRASPSTNPAIVIRCFVPNCGKCNTFNPYICTQCNTGYQLSAGFACRSCQPGYEQNLDVQSFTCTKCQDGFTSNGGVGEASQCYKITATSGRRLFDADEDLWA